MTWRNADRTAPAGDDARTSRLTCDATRTRYTRTRTGTFRAAGTVPCYAAAIGFPAAAAARDAARDAGWQTAAYGQNIDRCPTHRTTPIGTPQI